MGVNQKNIKQWIDPTKVQLNLYRKDDNSRISLTIGVNCEMRFQDVLYISEEKSGYRAKYNNHMYKNIPLQTIEDYINIHSSAFHKKLIWFYEKETRLIVKITDEKLIDRELIEREDSPYRIELKIPEQVYKNIFITFSPKYKSMEEIQAQLQKEGFKKLLSKKSLSLYAGEIDIDLCRECDLKCCDKECKIRK